MAGAEATRAKALEALSGLHSRFQQTADALKDSTEAAAAVSEKDMGKEKKEGSDKKEADADAGTYCTDA